MNKNEENFSAMNETIRMLRDRVLDCLDSSDLKVIMHKFAQFDGPTIVTGSGGSSVVAKFIAKVLNEKNGIICSALLPEEILRTNLNPYKNLLAVSGSGNSSGTENALNYAKNCGLNCEILTHSNKFDKEHNIVYKTSLAEENSFISFANTIMPMALALCYYLGDINKAKFLISDMFDVSRSNPVNVCAGEIYEIIGKESCPTACAFVESCLNESSIATPVVSGKYDMCHGRTTSILNQDGRQIIYFLVEQDSEVDQFLRVRLSDAGVGKRMTTTYADCGDYILDDFYMTLKMAYWCCDLAKMKGVDLSSMTINGKRIHLPFDKRAVAIWEKVNGKSFWSNDKPAWTELRDVGDGVRAPGFYAPTGKFVSVNLGEPGCDMGYNERLEWLLHDEVSTLNPDTKTRKNDEPTLEKK